MSIAGILAGNLFSGAGTQYASQTPRSPFGTSSVPSEFAALQQKLSQASSVAQPAASSVPSEMSQLGQDLNLGNLSAAQADYSALKIAIAQHHTRLNGQPGMATAAGGNSSSQAGASGNVTDPLSAAMQAYGSLQQMAANGALSSSLINPSSTFSINA